MGSEHLRSCSILCRKYPHARVTARPLSAWWLVCDGECAANLHRGVYEDGTCGAYTSNRQQAKHAARLSSKVDVTSYTTAGQPMTICARSKSATSI